MTHDDKRIRRQVVAEYLRNPAHTKQMACEKFGVSLTYVKIACTEHSVNFGKPIPSPNSFAVMRELWNGKTQSDVARELGITRQRVEQICKAAIEGGWIELKKCKRGAK